MGAIVLGLARLAVVLITITIFVDANCRQFAPDDCQCWHDQAELLAAKENCPQYVQPMQCDTNRKYRCRWFGSGEIEALGCNSDESRLFIWKPPSELITREQTPLEWADPYAALWRQWDKAYKNQDEGTLIKIFINQYVRIEMTQEQGLEFERLQNNIYIGLWKIDLLALKTYTDYSDECSKFRSAFRFSCDGQEIPEHKWQCITYHQIWNDALKHAFEHIHESYIHSDHQKKVLERHLETATHQQQEQIRHRIDELNRNIAAKYSKPLKVYHGENQICDDLFETFLLKETIKLFGPLSTSLLEGIAHEFARKPNSNFGIIFDLLPVYEQNGIPNEYTPPIAVQYLSKHDTEREILFYDGTFNVIGYRTIQHRATEVISKEVAKTCMDIINDNLSPVEFPEWMEMDRDRKMQLKKWCYSKRYGYEECWEKVAKVSHFQFEDVPLLQDRDGFGGYNWIATLQKCHRLMDGITTSIHIDKIRAHFGSNRDVGICVKHMKRFIHVTMIPKPRLVQKAQIEYYNNMDYATELSDNFGSKHQSLSSISYYDKNLYEQLLYLGVTILFVLLLCTVYLLVCIVCWIFGYCIEIKK